VIHVIKESRTVNYANQMISESQLCVNNAQNFMKLRLKDVLLLIVMF